MRIFLSVATSNRSCTFTILLVPILTCLRDEISLGKGRTLFALKRYEEARDAYYKNQTPIIGKMVPYSWGWNKNQPDFWER